MDFNVLFQPIYQVTQKRLLNLSGTQNKRRLHNRSRLLYKLLCHLGHMIQQIQWRLSAADGNTDRCPWQVTVGESQCRFLGFSNKTLPSSVDNYSPLQKELLAYIRY